MKSCYLEKDKAYIRGRYIPAIRIRSLGAHGGAVIPVPEKESDAPAAAAALRKLFAQLEDAA